MVKIGKDINLRFGVSGGGSLSGESGSAILADLKSIASQIESSGTTKLKFKLDTSTINQQIQKTINQTSNLGTNLNKSVSQTNISKVTDSFTKLQTKIAAIANTGQDLSKLTIEFQKLSSAKATFDQAPTSANLDAYRAQQTVVASLAKEMQSVSKANIQGVSNSFADLNQQLDLLSKSGTDISQLSSAFTQLGVAKDAFDKAPTAANLDAYNSQKLALTGLIGTMNTATQAQIKNQQATHATENDLVQYRKILAQVEAEYSKYSSNIQKNTELNSQYQTVISKLQSGISSGTFNFKDVTDARNQLAALDQQTTESGAKVQTLRQQIEQLFGAHLSTAFVMTGIHLLQQALTQIYQNVVEIDTAMTSLKKVTDETDAVYSEFLDNATVRAQKLGAIVSDVVQATADFSRLGFNLEDASTLADAALVYKNVGDGITDVTTASESLISTIKSFGIAASDATSIVDAYNAVGNKFAMTSADIGTALQTASSALASANNSMEESIGLAVGMNATVQNAEKVGEILRPAA